MATVCNNHSVGRNNHCNLYKICPISLYSFKFCHREYNEKEKLAKERFHVHERIWSDEKSWEDPDYPFDWTEGEFC